MSEGGTHTRRQLTLFATGEIAKRIDAVRRVVDPVQHALIPAHVTLCREDELASLSPTEIEKRVRRLAQGPLALRFGRAERFDGHGLLLRCIDGQADYQRLRVALLGSAAIRQSAAHLTLAHPRNPASAGNSLSAADLLPAEFALRFDTFWLIEQRDGGPWTRCGEFRFAPEYPHARRDESAGYTAHGLRYDDPFLWMESLNDPEVEAWIAAQERLTRSYFDAVPGRDHIRQLLQAAHRYPHASLPMVRGERSFFWQAEAGAEKPTLMVRTSGQAAAVVVLDPNAWNTDESLDFALPSPNGRYVAFGTSRGGGHDSQIRIWDVDRRELLPDQPRGQHHASPAWHPSSESLFYSANPDRGEVPPEDASHWVSIYEHRIGSSERAERIFGDDVVKEYWCSVETSECGRFALLYKWDFVHANAVHLLRLSDRAMIPVVPEVQALHRVQVIDDSILILTDRDAPRGRLWIARLDAPTEWRTLIREGDDVLQSVNGIGGRLYAVYSHNAAHQIRVFARDGTYLRDVPLPSIGSVNRNDGEGVVSGVSGSWRGDEVRVSFMSFAQPPSIYRYDFEGDQLHPIAVPSTGIDLSDVVTEQVWIDAPDGTKVSMFLVHRGDAIPDGKRLVRLSGYGGFNIAIEPRYGPVHAAWLALGGVLAFVNVRGGGEYGRAWHEAATKTKKRVSFTDFIAAARWLVSAGWTTSDRIAARGNSNGGLLVAASANLAPDAFGAVFSRAPILDMLRFPRFGQLSAAVVEYGSPDDAVEGPYLAAYSPYHAIRPDARYPVMAFVCALNDQVAPPHDPLKVVAKLQSDCESGGPFLLIPLRGSGHAGGTTVSMLVEQDLDELSFYLWALGAEPGEPARAARD